MKCNDNQQFDVPSEWPECVDKLDCPAPVYDNFVMDIDPDSTWSDGDSLTPPFQIE